MHAGLSHPFLGIGPGPRNWENSGVLTKIGKICIMYMYGVSIARLIPIVNLALFLDIYKISFNN